MGMADVIPGVSGGTIAFILGIYTRWMDAIKSVNGHAVKTLLRLRIKDLFTIVHWRFLAALLLGMVSGMFFCVRIVKLPELMKSHPEPVYGLFFGLILGSIVLLARDSGRPGLSGIVSYLAGGALCWVVVSAVPAETPNHPAFLFLCGAVAICAMVLPGISGSFVLVLLKKYEYVWGAFGILVGKTHPEITWLQALTEIMLPFVFGILFGLAIFSRFLSWLLHHYERLTIMAMNGLLIVSLYPIFPFQHSIYEKVAGRDRLVQTKPFWPDSESFFNNDGVLSVVLLAAGFVVVLVIDRLARRKAGAIAAPAPSAAGH
ncbi:MAG: DUF368 domain-containing protein [Planctomycetes bacterium]|nr:DUF368 domain-containing protein [Planctomycetota bacterium]